MSEPKKVDRRKFIYAGLGAVALIAIGAAAYVAMNPPVVTKTVTTSTTATTTVPTTSVVTTTAPVKKKFEGRKISVIWPTNPEESLSKIDVGAWTQLTGAKVELTELPEHPYVREKELMECSGHTGAFDVLAVDFMWVAEYAKAGYLYRIDKLVKEYGWCDEYDMDIDDFIPRCFSGTCVGVFDNRVYALPYSQGMGLVAFRKDLFIKAGLSDSKGNPLVPKTPEELIDFAKTLTDKKKGIYGFSMMCRRGSYATHNYLFEQLGHGARLINPDWTAGVNSPESIEAVEVLCQLVPYCPPGVLEFGWSENIGSFQKGEAAMCLIYSPYAPTLWDPTVSVVPKENVGFFLRPAKPGYYGSALFGSWVLAVSVDSKNKDVAWDFIQYLASKPVMQDWARRGGPVSRYSTAKDPEVLERFPNYAPALEFYTSPGCNPCQRVKIPEYGAIEETLGEWLSMAYSGKLTPKEAMDSAANDINKIMKEAGYFTPGTDAYNYPKIAIATTPEELKYFDKKPSEWLG